MIYEEYVAALNLAYEKKDVLGAIEVLTADFIPTEDEQLSIKTILYLLLDDCEDLELQKTLLTVLLNLEWLKTYLESNTDESEIYIETAIKIADINLLQTCLDLGGVRAYLSDAYNASRRVDNILEQKNWTLLSAFASYVSQINSEVAEKIAYEKSQALESYIKSHDVQSFTGLFATGINLDERAVFAIVTELFKDCDAEKLNDNFMLNKNQKEQMLRQLLACPAFLEQVKNLDGLQFFTLLNCALNLNASEFLPPLIECISDEHAKNWRDCGYAHNKSSADFVAYLHGNARLDVLAKLFDDEVYKLFLLFEALSEHQKPQVLTDVFSLPSVRAILCEESNITQAVDYFVEKNRLDFLIHIYTDELQKSKDLMRHEKEIICGLLRENQDNSEKIRQLLDLDWCTDRLPLLKEFAFQFDYQGAKDRIAVDAELKTRFINTFKALLSHEDLILKTFNVNNINSRSQTVDWRDWLDANDSNQILGQCVSIACYLNLWEINDVLLRHENLSNSSLLSEFFINNLPYLCMYLKSNIDKLYKYESFFTRLRDDTSQELLNLLVADPESEFVLRKLLQIPKCFSNAAVLLIENVDERFKQPVIQALQSYIAHMQEYPATLQQDGEVYKFVCFLQNAVYVDSDLSDQIIEIIAPKWNPAVMQDLYTQSLEKTKPAAEVAKLIAEAHQAHAAKCYDLATISSMAHVAQRHRFGAAHVKIDLVQYFRGEKYSLIADDIIKIANLHLERNETDAALQYLNFINHRDYNNNIAPYLLGNIFEQQGKMQRAAESYLKAAKRGNLDALSALSRLIMDNLASPGCAEIHAMLKCYITTEVMVAPVTTKEGHSFEEKFLLDWFKASRSNKSPATGKYLDASKPDFLIKNKTLANLTEYLAVNSDVKMFSGIYEFEEPERGNLLSKPVLNKNGYLSSLENLSWQDRMSGRYRPDFCMTNVINFLRTSTTPTPVEPMAEPTDPAPMTIVYNLETPTPKMIFSPADQSSLEYYLYDSELNKHETQIVVYTGNKTNLKPN